MSVDQTDLAPGYAVSRMIRGGWQLAGGHGPVDRARAIEDMFAFMDHGVTTFDCADIYTGVEDMYGDFRRRLADRRGEEAARAFKVHTKFVPDRDMLQRIDKQYVTGIIDRSLQRLATERLDLVQFHIGGTMRCRARSRPAGCWSSCGARARSRSLRGRTSTRRTASPCSMQESRSCRCRFSIRCSTPARKMAW